MWKRMVNEIEYGWYENPWKETPGTDEEWKDWETWGKELEETTRKKREEYAALRKY